MLGKLTLRMRRYSFPVIPHNCALRTLLRENSGLANCGNVEFGSGVLHVNLRLFCGAKQLAVEVPKSDPLSRPSDSDAVFMFTTTNPMDLKTATEK